MSVQKYFTWTFLRGLPRGLAHKLAGRLFLFKSRKEQFTYVFQQGGFGNSPSLSGSGSDLEQTRVVREEVSRLLRELSITSILDIPCGDWYWMRHVDLRGIRYIGADIVPGLIQRNIAEFGTSDEHSFIVRDLCCDELPKVDLVFCRDCLVHLRLGDGRKALQNIRRSGSRYLLATTHPSRTVNPELKPNFFRPLNLQLPPFCLPAPLRLISEQCTEDNGAFADKSLGLWDLADVRL
jgi:SAM-dependent methyltransferase